MWYAVSLAVAISCQTIAKVCEKHFLGGTSRWQLILFNKWTLKEVCRRDIPPISDMKLRLKYVGIS